MINLNNILKVAGQKIVKELSNNIREQKQIDGKIINSVSFSTMKIRLKKGMTSVTRLLYTGYFWQNAFKYIVNNNTLTIYANTSQYPGSSVSYEDIISYNDVDNERTNQRVSPSNRPKIFPKYEEDLLKMKCIDEIKKDIEKETIMQIEQNFGPIPKITLVIG